MSIGLCASAMLPPEATCEQRMKAALAALCTPKARKESFTPSPATDAPV
jgi:hypothetical protein